MISVLTMILVLTVIPQDVNTQFFAANGLYREGKFQQAVSSYERLLDEGFISSSLYFNLGNSYFKMGRRGKAILYYKRAQRLAPRDPDIEANLRFAFSLVDGYTGEESPNWFAGKWERAYSTVNLRELGILVVGLCWLLSGGIVAGILMKRRKRLAWYVNLVLGVMLLFFILCQVSQWYAFTHQQWAVIVLEKSEAHFEPSKEATRHFALDEGALVRVIERKGVWTKGLRRDGKKGWLPTSTLEEI